MRVFSDPVLQDIWDANSRGKEAKLDGRQVNADAFGELVRLAALDPGFSPWGIHIRDATVDGLLDLHNFDLPFHVRFHNVQFPGGLNISHLKVRTLELLGCSLRFLVGRTARIRGNLKILGACCEGAMVFEGARIAGRASFGRSCLMTAGPGAVDHARDNTVEKDYLRDQRERERHHGLVLSVAKIGGELRLNGVKSRAPLLMDHVEIGKRLMMQDARIEGLKDNCPYRARFHVDYALRAGGLSATGNADFRDSCFGDQVLLTGARIVGRLLFPGVTIQGRNHVALRLDRASIHGDLAFGQRDDDRNSVIGGSILLRQAEIGGDFNLSDTTLSYCCDNAGSEAEDGFCLRAIGCRINGEFRAVKLTTRGALQLANTQIGMRLRFRDCVLRSAASSPGVDRPEDDRVLDASLLRVEGDVSFEGVKCAGQLLCPDAEFLGNLRCTNSWFFHKGDFAIAAERLRVSGNVEFRSDPAAPGRWPTRITGGLLMADAQIDGSLILDSGLYQCQEETPSDVTAPCRAVEATSISVGRQVAIGGSTEFAGLINLAEARVGEDVRVAGWFHSGPRGENIRFIGAQIAGSLFLGSGSRRNGLHPRLAQKANRRLHRKIDSPYPSLVSKGRITINTARIDGFLRILSAHVEWDTGGAQAEADQETAASYQHYSIYASTVEVGRDLFSWRAHPDTPDGPGGRPSDEERKRYRVVLIGPMSLEQAQVTGNVNLDLMCIYNVPGEITGETGGGNGAAPYPEIRRRALYAAGMKVRRSLFFGSGFRSFGEVELIRAEIGQNFRSSGHHRLPADLAGFARDVVRIKSIRTPAVLACESMHVGGAVELQRCRLRGLADFTLADVTGSVWILGARLCNADEVALDMSAAVLHRNLVIGRDSRTNGVVDLSGTRIGNDLEIRAETFRPAGRGGTRARNPSCEPPAIFHELPNLGLRARRMQVMNTFYWGRDRGANGQEPKPLRKRRGRSSRPPIENPHYRVDLSDASVGTLMDHEQAWPAKGALWLNGFSYRAIGHGSTTDWRCRFRWLMRQKRKGEPLQPGVFDQLTLVYRQMGLFSAAESIDVKKFTTRRSMAGSPVRRALRWLHYLTIGLGTRYGYQPSRALAGLVIFWAIGCAVFSQAYAYHSYDGNLRPGGRPSSIGDQAGQLARCMAPSHEEFYVNLSVTQVPNGASLPRMNVAATPWSVPEFYPRFRAGLYSLDTILPIVNLFHDSYWIPASYPHCRRELRLPSVNLARLEALLTGQAAASGPEALVTFDRITVYPYQLYLSFHVLMGWVFTTIFGLAITGLIRPKPEVRERAPGPGA